MAKNRRKKVKGNRKGVLRSGRPNTYKKYKHKLKTAPERKPVVYDWTLPEGSDGVEACKARVANGMKCYCLEVCGCRNCDSCKTLNPPPDCYAPCMSCSNHKPCR